MALLHLHLHPMQHRWTTILLVPVSATFARSRLPLGRQLPPQGPNLADSHCELVVVPRHVSMLSPNFQF
jgi:hypothetical protein